MGKEDPIEYYEEGLTIFPYENVSHSNPGGGNVVEISFIYNSNKLILRGKEASKFKTEYTNFLNHKKRLHL